jgi:hypothetical protein
MVLAGIEFAVSGLVWSLKRESLDELAAKFLIKFTVIAFLLSLITSFDMWFPAIAAQEERSRPGPRLRRYAPGARAMSSGCISHPSSARSRAGRDARHGQPGRRRVDGHEPVACPVG